MNPVGISLKNISFSYTNPNNPINTNKLHIFKDFSIKFQAAKVSVILGPSGCGKSTLLNIIHGIITPDSGIIKKDNNSTISYIFQEPRLLPWKTVGQNIDLILKSHYEHKQRQKIIQHYLEIIGLINFADYYPSELSGGMRQRVAIARAFAYPAEIILMDEPFQALDPGLKLNLTKLFSTLWIQDNRTSLFVTHDITEAIYLGDEIFVLSSSFPSKIVDQIINPVPRADRQSENPDFLEIKNKLYSLLTS
jgi:NitT/TauT family transport system ATP-binding protein